MMTSAQITQRLGIFIEAGLLECAPTPFQLRQAEIEMAPYVVSTDATERRGYEGKPLGHPVLRQPLIISQVGPDHFRLGSGLGAGLEAQITHLHLTYHVGMPVFDLQVIQTHDVGLDRLERRTRALLDGPLRGVAKRHDRLASLIFSDRHSYWRKFVSPGGYIDRARAFDYDDAIVAGTTFPPEFFSLINLARYATTFPANRAAVGSLRLPAHVINLLRRRSRSGGRLGWLAA